MSDQPQPVAWIEELVSFLRSQPDIRAVRVDLTGKKLSVATIGDIDPAASQQALCRLIAVPGVETAREAAELAATQGAAGGSGVGWAKDLRFLQEAPLSVRHRPPFVQVLLVKRPIQTITGL